MDPFLAGGLISAGGNLLSSALGIGASRSAEDRSFERSLQMQKMQNDFNVNMWNKTNAYNSPAHQAQLYREAGYNPALYTPGSSNASEVTASNASVPQNSEIGGLYAHMNPVERVIQALSSDAQIEKLRTDIKYQKLVNRDLENQLSAKEWLREYDDHYGTQYTHDRVMNDREKDASVRMNEEQYEVFHNTRSFLEKMPAQQLRALQEDVNSKVMSNDILGREVEIMRKYGISPNDKDGLLSLLKVALTDPQAFNKIIDAVLGSASATGGNLLQKATNVIKGFGFSHKNPNFNTPRSSGFR